MGDGTMNPLAQKFTAVSLLKFAFPTMITMLFMGLYTIGDTIFVSRFVNTDALSAINMVTPVINIIVGLGTMLATGGSAVIARKMGEGKEREASQDFALIVFCGAALGIWIAVTGVLCMDEIIRGLGAGERLFPYCREYLMILLLFTPASILQVLFQNLIVTAGRPGFGMALSLGAGAANVVLDYIFMVPFGMGIRGSALGTQAADTFLYNYSSDAPYRKVSPISHSCHHRSHCLVQVPDYNTGYCHHNNHYPIRCFL